MAYDLARRAVSGKDWSCGIGDADRAPRAGIAAGAALLGLTVAGVFVASSMGGSRDSGTMVIDRPKRPRRPSGPPTMILSPAGDGRFGVNPQARRYFSK